MNASSGCLVGTLAAGDVNAAASDGVGLARHVRCTPARLRREFRDAFGMSPAAYQRQLRLWEATRLLTRTTLKVEAVANAVGYRSKKNFYRATRALTGQTPTVVGKRR